MFTPRTSQSSILEYTGGKLGVAAVPGSGKTRTLSALAAKLIAEQLQDHQEVLIVTLVNAAVENFVVQIRAFLNERGLLPGAGYRVRTLHGLCSDIVRQNPGLLALADGFTILDEREAGDLLSDAAAAALRANPDLPQALLAADLEQGRRDSLVREDLPSLLTDIANAFIQRAKDLMLTPERVHEVLASYPEPLPLARACADIYTTYQRALTYRGAVDFQDLIRLALQALERDPALVARLQTQWPYILEDEAQDSSQLQERILRLLVGDGGNWVRVGDPNQAIYETFTTANPELLWRFLEEVGVQALDLPESGRSAEPIQALANHLITWSAALHPNGAVRERRPLRPPMIQPTQPGDPQPNPPSATARIAFLGEAVNPAGEIERTVASLSRWLPEHPNETCAVLVPRNRRGYDLIDYLSKNAIDLPLVEVLQSSTSTRLAAGALGNILTFLERPDAPGWLARAYRVWRRDTRDDDEANTRTLTIAKLLGDLERVEDFIAPAPGTRDWLREDSGPAQDSELADELAAFRERVRRWCAASVLPIDQLILVLADDLFTEPADIALAHSLAVVLRGYANRQPAWRLPEFTLALAEISRRERRFLGMDGAARAFNPNDHPGKVAITTMHSAKGLEWDRVYLLSVNNYDFPSGLPGDTYFDEKYFARSALNLRAETLAQLQAAANPNAAEYTEGKPTLRARDELVGERLRLLYVAITRARKELIVSYNTGRRRDLTPAVAFVELRRFAQTEIGLMSEDA